MVSILISLALVGQTAPGRTDNQVALPASGPAASTNAAKQWFQLTNMPGYEGYGSLNQNGYLIVEQYRQTGTTQGTVTAAQPAKQWYQVSNYPGYEGYGYVDQNGYLVAEQYRQTGTTTQQPAASTGTQVQQASYQPAQTVQYYQQPTYQQQATVGDAYGFTNWLNGVRGQYGLPAVGYDPNLESWAQQNNSQQNSRGMGHYVMGPARRQNSAMGNYASIGAMWLASPAHRAALLDPTIRFVGLAGLGAYWTFNAY